VLGSQIADGAYFWAGLCAGGLAALVLQRIQSQPLGTLLMGGLLVGYIVGNRGFAQLSLLSVFPLLPAEFVLLVASVILVVQCARRRELPLRYDALNLTLFVWMLIGTVRLLFDIRAHGLPRCATMPWSITARFSSSPTRRPRRRLGAVPAPLRAGRLWPAARSSPRSRPSSPNFFSVP